MKRLGPAVVLAVVALAAVRAAAQDGNFIPEEALIDRHRGPPVLWFEWESMTAPTLILGGVSHLLALVALAAGRYRLARGTSWVSLMCGAAITAAVLPQIAVPGHELQASDAYLQTLGVGNRFLAIGGPFLAIAGYLVIHAAERGRKRPTTVPAETAAANRLENRKRGVTLPVDADADSHGGDPTPTR